MLRCVGLVEQDLCKSFGHLKRHTKLSIERSLGDYKINLESGARRV